MENSCRYNTKPYEGNQIPETPGHVRSVVINKKGGFLLGSRTIARATYKEIIMAKLANPRLSNKEIAAHMGRAFATVKTADAIRLEFEKAGMEGL